MRNLTCLAIKIAPTNLAMMRDRKNIQRFRETCALFYVPCALSLQLENSHIFKLYNTDVQNSQYQNNIFTSSITNT